MTSIEPDEKPDDIIKLPWGSVRTDLVNVDITVEQTRSQVPTYDYYEHLSYIDGEGVQAFKI